MIIDSTEALGFRSLGGSDITYLINKTKSSIPEFSFENFEAAPGGAATSQFSVYSIYYLIRPQKVARPQYFQFPQI